jgi:hypothetical protein
MVKKKLNFYKQTLTPDEIKSATELLSAWGGLTCLEQNGPGSHSTNVLHRFAKLGINLPSTHQGVPWIYETERIDELINELSKLKPKWAKALIRRYTEPSNVREQAKACGLPKSTFHEHFQKGENWVAQEMRSLH